MTPSVLTSSIFEPEVLEGDRMEEVEGEGGEERSEYDDDESIQQHSTPTSSWPPRVHQKTHRLLSSIVNHPRIQ